MGGAVRRRYYRVRPELMDRYRPYSGGLYREISPPNPQGYACVLLGNRVQVIDTRDFELLELDEQDPSLWIGYRVRPEHLASYPPYDGGLYRELRRANHAGFARVLIAGRIRWVLADHFDRVLERSPEGYPPPTRGSESSRPDGRAAGAPVMGATGPAAAAEFPVPTVELPAPR